MFPAKNQLRREYCEAMDLKTPCREMAPNLNRIQTKGAPMSIAAETAPSRLEAPNPTIIVAGGRRPALTIVLLGAVLVALAWGATMVWLARLMFAAQ
jgi:hypothetical protein